MNAHVDTDAAQAGATRRELVVGTALVSGALLVGCSPADLLAVGAKTEVGAFGPFIRIAADGAVTVFNKHIEFGPGRHSGPAADVPRGEGGAASGGCTAGQGGAAWVGGGGRWGARRGPTGCR